MAIKVAEQKLTVYAPFYVPQTEIDAWLNTKQDWVAEQIAKQSMQAERRQLPLVNATIKLFGQNVPIVFGKVQKHLATRCAASAYLTNIITCQTSRG
ncbi:YgjP-like metallopeptidase domain-containing protein [Pseudoalteromonas sp. GB43]